MSDIDLENLEQEDRLAPWLNDPSEEAQDVWSDWHGEEW